MPEYITDLVYYIRDSFSDGRRVQFDLSLDPISLDVLQAVPVGLILNELVTNAFKYAFRHGPSDTVVITLQQSETRLTELFIGDNCKFWPC